MKYQREVVLPVRKELCATLKSCWKSRNTGEGDARGVENHQRFVENNMSEAKTQWAEMQKYRVKKRNSLQRVWNCYRVCVCDWMHGKIIKYQKESQFICFSGIYLHNTDENEKHTNNAVCCNCWKCAFSTATHTHTLHWSQSVRKP